MKILELLKQRRIWAGIFGATAIILPMLRVNVDLDVNGLTNSMMDLVTAISAISTMILPIISFFKPKPKPIN